MDTQTTVSTAKPEGEPQPFEATIGEMIRGDYPSGPYIDFVEEEARKCILFHHECYDKLKAEGHRLISLQIVLASAAIGFATPLLSSSENADSPLVMPILWAGLAFALLGAATAIVLLKQRQVPAPHNEPENLLLLHYWGESEGDTDEDTSLTGLRMDELKNKQADIEKLRDINKKMGRVLNWARGLTAAVPIGLAASVARLFA